MILHQLQMSKRYAYDCYGYSPDEEMDYWRSAGLHGYSLKIGEFDHYKGHVHTGIYCKECGTESPTWKYAEYRCPLPKQCRAIGAKKLVENARRLTLDQQIKKLEDDIATPVHDERHIVQPPSYEECMKDIKYSWV